MSRTHPTTLQGGALLVALGLLGLALPATAAAQTTGMTPKVFYACYIQSSGVVYRIKEPGLRQTCLGNESGPHTEFSWTEGLPAHDHGALNGLADDDHPQYLLVNAATRSLVASLNAAGFKITGLAAATAAGEAVRYEQAVKQGDAAGGDLAGTYPAPRVAGLQGSAVSTTPPADGQVLTWNQTSGAWTPTAPAMVLSDHDGLAGLADDDHPQYLLGDGTRALTGALGAGGFKITGLAAASADGDAVRFEQAVKSGDAAGGDLSGTYPAPTVAKLQGAGVSSTAPTTGQVLSFDGTNWTPATPASGATDHGLLTGRDDDDHLQYLLTDGVRNATGGFAVTGTFGTGTIPAEGAGTRLMWYPGKAAFRSGRVFADRWNDENIGSYSTATGIETEASGGGSTAMGNFTRATGGGATAFGDGTVASGGASTAVGAGATASGDGSLAAGITTTAAGRSAIALGYRTTASGESSTAMGRSASASGWGSFVYGDASTNIVFARTVDNEFAVRAVGGVHFFTSANLSTGCTLAAGSGSWNCTSSRHAKENFEDLDGEDVLEEIAAMPIQTWNYRAEGGGVRHVGATAQDFYAAFQLGSSDESISMVDADGINLLAIQALERRTGELREKSQRIEILETRLAELERRLAKLENH